ncbi:amidohydrolase family protein [Mucilaginibacter mali]|uniref:Amidohydrolase family protein n=1 Tax=Mucilaginibacter mali TaxID=2740462 RepID=A0A7D4UBX3_9SPHI|nr:amidohydrolase family protein [Mucilaginibacter mali]QKJ28599.1 amidohydrolase family protein [Mucilaginibacter mali]
MAHHHTHGCTHCACNNPIFEILGETIFSKENREKMTAAAPPKSIFPAEPQATIFTGGIIRPMIGGSTDTVEAIGIANGNVVVSGTELHVKEYMLFHHPFHATKTLSATQTLLPGFIDPHVHIMPTALTTGWLDVGGFNGQDLQADYGMEYVAKVIKGRQNYPVDFIFGKDMDPALMPFIPSLDEAQMELQTIHYDDLDKIDAKTPMFLLSASMHTLYVNSPALKLAFDNNEAIRQKYGTLHEYRQQTKGQLQEEAEMRPALEVLEVKAQLAILSIPAIKYLDELFALANSRGITFLYDAAMTPDYKLGLDAYFDLGYKKIRVGAAQLCLTNQDVDNLPQYTQPSAYGHVYYAHAKLVTDGSNQGLTGYQSEPYCCNPLDNYGLFNFPEAGVPAQIVPPSYEALVTDVVVNKGWPLMIHANGDTAVTFAIEAYQNAVKPGNTVRHRIEHCSLLTNNQIDTMSKLGISPSFLIGHVGYWGYAFSQVIFGKEKVQFLDRCKSTLDKGLRITLHSDNQVTPLGTLRMMEQAITRFMEAGPDDTGNNILNPAECITPEQALVAVTYDAAWQCYADQWVGSLNTGLFADFVILENDPLNLPEDLQMRNITVSETWVGGIPVYTA